MANVSSGANLNNLNSVFWDLSANHKNNTVLQMTNQQNNTQIINEIGWNGFFSGGHLPMNERIATNLFKIK